MSTSRAAIQVRLSVMFSSRRQHEQGVVVDGQRLPLQLFLPTPSHPCPALEEKEKMEEEEELVEEEELEEEERKEE